MVERESLKKRVKAEVDEILPRLVEMSDWFGRHPELGSEEHQSSKLLADELDRHSFTVERWV